jgi:hypothetical protein
MLLVVSMVLAAIVTYLKLKLTPTWFDGRLEANHALLLAFDFTNNEQSRLLQFYIPELFHRLFGLRIINAYILQRFLFSTLTFIGFYFFSRKWFSPKLAIIGLVLLALIIINTHVDDLQESVSLLSLTFLGTLWAIRESKTLWYVLVLFIGSINNETMLFVPALYFFFNLKSFKFKALFKLGIKTIVLALPAFIIVGVIRYVNIDRPHLGGALHFYDNIVRIHRLFRVFNIMWFLAIIYFNRKPLFIQRALLSIPLFILPHMITGIISETRQMIPLSFIIIPAALFTVIEMYNFFRKKKNRI